MDGNFFFAATSKDVTPRHHHHHRHRRNGRRRHHLISHRDDRSRQPSNYLVENVIDGYFLFVELLVDESNSSFMVIHGDGGNLLMVTRSSTIPATCRILDRRMSLFLYDEEDVTTAAPSAIPMPRRASSFLRDKEKSTTASASSTARAASSIAQASRRLPDRREITILRSHLWQRSNIFMGAAVFVHDDGDSPYLQ